MCFRNPLAARTLPATKRDYTPIDGSLIFRYDLSMKKRRDKHVPAFTLQMTLPQFERMFPDEDSCREYLMNQRWPKGVTCPRCGSGDNVYALRTQRQPWKWECRNPACISGHAYRFSVLVGTIFEDTKMPLRTWFWVLFLMLTSKKGISALQIHRTIETGSYRTAFFICHRLRASLKDPEFRQLMGIVEVDETGIGGKAIWRHKSAPKQRRGGWDKPTVIGAIARKGNVVCQMIESADIPTMTKFVRKVVDKEKVELVATDEHSGYFYLDKDGYKHETVDHRRGEYVRGVVHTNSMENFWSLLKRGIVGTYHHVSKKYLPLYLNEFSYRFNNRGNKDIFRDAVAGC